MNGIRIVQNGIIAGIHFSRHMDSSGTIVKSLYEKIGYGITLSLQNSMYLCVMPDRGYHTLAVTRYIMKMGNSFLGTHWETIAVKNRDIQLHQLVFQLPQNVNITGDGICIA